MGGTEGSAHFCTCILSVCSITKMRTSADNRPVKQKTRQSSGFLFAIVEAVVKSGEILRSQLCDTNED